VDAGQFVSSLLSAGGMRPSDKLNEWGYRMIGEEPPDEPDLLGTLREAQSPPALPAAPPTIAIPSTELEDIESDDAPSELPESMTADEAADLLRVSKNVIHRAIQTGRLPGAKVGNQYRILRSNLLAWLEASPSGGNGGMMTP